MLKQLTENMTGDKSHTEKLAVICNTTRCGGVYRVVSNLCNAWSRQGRKVFLIALYDYPSFFHLEPSITRVDALASPQDTHLARIRRKGESLLARCLAGLRHLWPSEISDYLFGNAGLFWFSHRVKPLRAAIQRTDASVIIAFGLQANILTILASRNLDRKVVISERTDVSYGRLEYPWEELRTGLYNRADIITANTHGALKAMQAYVDYEKLVFVPNFIVCENNGKESPRLSSLKAPVVLIVANLNELKAHDVLLNAFARLSPELANWRLAIVGGGEAEKPLRQRVKSLGIAWRVDWYGQIANPISFYRAASIFVLPSRCEGMPNALMEAMSCGLPVIVSNASPGPLDLVRDGETGLIVPVGDSFALAKAIEQLANNPILRKRLGKAGRKRVFEYDLPAVMAIWQRIIDTDPTPTRLTVSTSRF